ncbi:MAG: apolipoprotein N-acyltransferase [Prolixibacteraceae bacterium]
MKLKLISAALFSGILLSLAWVGFSGLFLLIAFIPLLWVDNYFIRHRKTNASIVFWWHSLLTFFVWNSLTVWWIWNATPVGAIFLILLNTFLMSFVWWIVHVIRRLKGEGFGNTFLVICWISFEYLQFKWDLSWPWFTLGNGFANDIQIIQWYEFTGVFGGSLWVILVNLAIWQLIKKLFILHQETYKLQMFIAIGILLVPMGISMIMFQTYHEKENSVQIVIAQPNIDPYTDKFDNMPFKEQYERLLSVSDSLGNDSVGFFLGPETALQEVWLNNWNYSPPIRLVQNFLADHYSRSAFILGAMTYKEYQLSEEPSSTAQYNSDSTLLYDGYNSALLITKDGPVSIYHKSKLVSGVEKMPFKKYLGIFDQFIIDLGGTTGSLATFNQTEVFDYNGVKVGVPICYESVFGEYTSGFVQEGAELIFIITNDGWWKNTPGYRQHLAYAKLLAIELRRSIARSGNTGISCFINQKGEIQQSTQWWTKTSITGTINRNSKETFYSQNGDFIARICLFLLVMFGLSVLVGFVTGKK